MFSALASSRHPCGPVPATLSGWKLRVEDCTAPLSQALVNCCTLARKACAAIMRPSLSRRGIMKNLLAVIGDGNAGPVLEAALMVARRFNSHIVGLHSLTTEYAVVFGGEMGFSISSEVDRTLEREGQERRDQARRLFRGFMEQNGVAIGRPTP